MKNDNDKDLFPGLFPDGTENKIKVVSDISRKKNKPMAFSFSKFSLYTECPLKYKFKYIDKFPEEPKFFFAFGHSIHSAMEFMYAVKSPPFPELRDVLEEFRREWGLKNWMQKGYMSKGLEEKAYYKGVNMLEAYYEKHHANFIVPFLLEYSTDVEVDGLRVRIIADKINYLGNGEIEIIDYKTGKNISRSPNQVRLYQKICELDPRLKDKIYQMYGDKVQDVKVRSIEYYYVPGLKEIKFERAGHDDIKGLWDGVLAASDGVRAAKFDPNPGELQCKFCDFKGSCPIFFKDKTIVPNESIPTNFDKNENYAKLSSLIDEYGEVLGKADAINAKLSKIKSEIEDMIKTKNLNAYSGKNYSLKAKVSDKWVFKDRNAVIKVLKELGFYDKVLAPVLTNIVALLNDNSLPETVKNKIKAKGEKRDLFDFKIERIGDD